MTKGMRMRQMALGVCVLLALLIAPSARAQEDDNNKQLDMALLGGIGDFTGTLASLTSAGPVWGVVLGFQPLTMVGLEVGYAGSRNTVSGTEGTLTRNGLTTLLKVSPPFMKKLRPFAGIGMGISHVSASNAGPFQSDTLEEVPLVAGIEFNTPAVTAGFRATYRFLIDDQLVPADQSPGGLFDAAVTLGGRF